MESFLIMRTLTSSLLPNKKYPRAVKPLSDFSVIYLGLRISRLPTNFSV